LASAETATKDTVLNALPTWAGGQVLTADQLSAIQSQTAANITQAAGGNTDLAQSEIEQMLGETSSVAQQAQDAAEASDDSDLPSVLPTAWQAFEAWVQANWGLLAIGGFGFLMIRSSGRRR
jgi:hypothetical protein